MEVLTADQKAFYESARKEAQKKCESDPQDTQALTRWGGALLELANFSPGDEASTMVDEAVDKFQTALKLDPRKHEAAVHRTIHSNEFRYTRSLLEDHPHCLLSSSKQAMSDHDHGPFRRQQLRSDCLLVEGPIHSVPHSSGLR